MLLPSGVHPTATSAAGWYVMRFGMPPVAGIVKTSVLPSYSPVNAIVLPSGEKIGWLSMPTPVVRCVARPPARGTVHRSPA